MSTSLQTSQKEVQIEHLHLKRFHLVQTKYAKIGPADPEIIVLREIINKEKKKRKKKEINANKIYSLVGNLAEWAKISLLLSIMFMSFQFLISANTNTETFGNYGQQIGDTTTHIKCELLKIPSCVKLTNFILNTNFIFKDCL